MFHQVKVNDLGQIAALHFSTIDKQVVPNSIMGALTQCKISMHVNHYKGSDY